MHFYDIPHNRSMKKSFQSRLLTQATPYKGEKRRGNSLIWLCFISIIFCSPLSAKQSKQTLYSVKFLLEKGSSSLRNFLQEASNQQSFKQTVQENSSDEPQAELTVIILKTKKTILQDSGSATKLIQNPPSTFSQFFDLPSGEKAPIFISAKVQNASPMEQTIARQSSENKIIRKKTPSNQIDERIFSDYLRKAEEVTEKLQKNSQDQTNTLEVRWTGSELITKPESLILRSGEMLRLKMKNFRAGHIPEIFIRDQNLISRQQNKRSDWLQVSETETGETELFFYFNNTLKILKAEITHSPSAEQNASLISSTSTHKRKTDDLPKDSKTANLFKALMKKKHKFSASENHIKPLFLSHNQNNPSVEIRFQIFDEQKKDKIPLAMAGVSVFIPGTDYAVQTAGDGLTPPLYVADDSRFILRTEAAKQADYMPGIHLIDPSIPGEILRGRKIIPLYLRKRNSFLSLQQYANEIHKLKQKNHQKTDSESTLTASACGYVLGEKNIGLDGVRIIPFIPDSLVLYQNEASKLPESGTTTDSSGWFCVFHNEPGPMGIEFVGKENKILGTHTIHLFSENYSLTNFSFAPYEQTQLVARLASIPSPIEHLQDEGSLENYQTVDRADIYPLGSQASPLPYLDDGIIGSETPLHTHRNRICLASEHAQFYAMYQCLTPDEASSGHAVLALTPAGFMEAISMATDKQFDNSFMGSVITEHGRLPEEGSTVSSQLINYNGRVFSADFVKHDKVITKHIFFNIPTDIYNMTVRDQEGQIIRIETITVFDQTVSYERTGRKIEAASSEFRQAQSLSPETLSRS